MKFHNNISLSIEIQELPVSESIYESIKMLNAQLFARRGKTKSLFDAAFDYIENVSSTDSDAKLVYNHESVLVGIALITFSHCSKILLKPKDVAWKSFS